MESIVRVAIFHVQFVLLRLVVSKVRAFFDGHQDVTQNLTWSQAFTKKLRHFVDMSNQIST